MLTVLMVDQRVGEMSSWRQRRAEYRRRSLVPRGGMLWDLRQPEPERSGSPANGMYQP
jgi:hypothetical protein